MQNRLSFTVLKALKLKTSTIQSLQTMKLQRLLRLKSSIHM